MKPPSRHLLLSGICVGIALTIGKLLLDPTTSQRQYTAIPLPQALPLPESQLLESQPIQLPQAESPKYDQILSGQKYRYIRSGIPIQLELRDVVNTGGNIHKLIQEQLSWKANPPKFQDVQTPIGFYRRFTQQGNVYLESCLSPAGHSFVTPAQFRSQLYQHIWQPDRLLGWAIGQNSLLDKRCLWVQLSIPTEKINSGSTTSNNQKFIANDDALAEQLLEEQWRSIASWWMSKSPTSGVR